MKITKGKLFMYSNLSFVASIAVASLLPSFTWGFGIWYFSFFLFFVLNIVIFRKNKKIVAVAILAAVFFFGIWRYVVSWPKGLENDILLEKEHSYIAQIVKEPDIRENHQKLTIEIQGEYKLYAVGKVLITTNLYPKYQYAEKISFSCQLARPEPFQEFYYDRYLAKDDIYYICYYPEIIEHGRGKENKLIKAIYRVKDFARERINKGLSEPSAGLSRAIILGEKREVRQDISEDFSSTGLSHIVAISGMHISILIFLLMWGFVYLGLSRRKAFYFVVGFLLIYIILVGAPASAFRAGLMGFFLLLAWQVGRLNKIIISLLFTASLTLLVNPKLLRDDIGWQLSFLAVWGIIWFYPPFKDYWQRIGWPKFWGLADIVIISLAVQIMIWPMVAYYFSYFSTVSVFANLLVIWLLPLIFGIGLIAIIVSIAIPGFEAIVFLPLQMVFTYLITVAHALAALPFSSIIFDIHIVWVIFYYILIILFYKKHIDKRKILN